MSLALRSGAAAVVAARIGVVELAAHQVASEIWTFLALVLDAIAIAGQAMVGRLLGAGDGSGARAASRRNARVGRREVTFPSAGEYRFSAVAGDDEGVRVYVDDKEIVNAVSPRSAPDVSSWSSSRADVLVLDTGDCLYTRRGTGWGGKPGKTWAAP